jgi:hypothetical protein
MGLVNQEKINALGLPGALIFSCYVELLFS